jgi:hypothetical protein
MARYRFDGFSGSFWHRNHLCGIVRTQNIQARDIGLDMVPLSRNFAGREAI